MSESGTTGNAAQQKRLDRESKLLLAQGASVSQLGLLFKMDNRTVSLKIQGLEPSAKRAGFPVYRIRDAAPYLCKPVGDFEEYIKGMNHRDLPPMLLKEFWSALKIKQSFEEEQGDLWRTDDVIDKFAQTFKTLRTSLLLLSDSVEREVSFSDRQRETLKAMVDTTLEELRVSLIEAFETDDDADGAEGDDDPAELADAADEAFWNVPAEEDQDSL